MNKEIYTIQNIKDILEKEEMRLINTRLPHNEYLHKYDELIQILKLFDLL